LSFFHYSSHHPYLHSFPTRRSSDLELLQPWHLRKRSLYPPRHSGGTIVGAPAARAASARGDRLHRGGIWPTATGRAFKHVERSRRPPPAKRATRRRDRALF